MILIPNFPLSGYNFLFLASPFFFFDSSQDMDRTLMMLSLFTISNSNFFTVASRLSWPFLLHHLPLMNHSFFIHFKFEFNYSLLNLRCYVLQHLLFNSRQMFLAAYPLLYLNAAVLSFLLQHLPSTIHNFLLQNISQLLVRASGTR